MRPPCKSAAETLAESPIAGLLEKARLLGRVSAAIESISRDLTATGNPLPPPRCSIQGRTVIVTVGNPSHAAKLRQQTDRIEQAARENLPDLTGIRIRLQPGGPNYRESAIQSPQPSPVGPGENMRAPDAAAALRFAEQLAATLHESDLRASVLRLQASLRAKTGR